MDYEKKYKELVGKIEKAYLYAQTDSTKAVLEEIRPELKSEDERIAEKYRSEQTPATTISAVNDANLTAITDGNTSVTSKEVEWQYCTGQYEPDVREFPIEWKHKNVDELSKFERSMLYIGGSFFGENAVLDPNDTATIKEQAKLLLELVTKQEWSEEDEEKFRDVIRLVEQGAPVQSIRDHYTNWLKSFKDKVQLQPKQEWSDVDRGILFRTIDSLKFLKDTISTDQKYVVNIIDIEREITWLKSLRPLNNYNPYKEVVESIAEMCKHYDKASHSGLRDFYDNVKVKCRDAKEYDSLFPQNTWKPSDEQIKVCKEVYADLLSAKGFDVGAINSELNRLEEQLKKLREK